MSDILDKATNIATLGVIAGMMFIGYKIAEGLGLFKKDQKPGDKSTGSIIPDGKKPVIMQPSPAATVIDMMGVPGSGGDMMKGPAALPTNVGTLFGEAAAQPSGAAVAKLVTSPANPLLNTANNILNLFGLGYRPPKATSQPKTTANNAPNVAASKPSGAISEVQSGGISSILLKPSVPASNEATQPLVSQSMGGTGVYSQDLGRLIDTGVKLPDSQLDEKYRVIPSSTPKPAYYKAPDGSAVSTDPSRLSQGWIPVYTGGR